MTAQMGYSTQNKIIARWESRGGKYQAELHYDPAFQLADGRTVIAAGYVGNGCGGSIDALSEADAIDKMQKRVDSGYFQADANKTPMKRTL